MNFSPSSYNYRFTLLGTPIKIHYTFFVLLLISVLSSLRKFHLLLTLHIILEYGPILLITIIIHEFGHLLACKALGGSTNRGMVLWPLGGFSYCGPTGKGLWGDFLVSIAGPLMHIPQSFIWYGLYYVLYVRGGNMNHGWFQNQVYAHQIQGDDLKHHFLALLFPRAVRLNIMLMIFNLLPMYPLDRAMVFVSSLLLCGIDQMKAGLIAAKAGMALSLIGAILSGFVITKSTFNLFVFGWIFYRSWKMYKLAQNERVDEHPLFDSAQFDGVNDDEIHGNASNDEVEMYIDYAQNEYAQRPWTQVSTSEDGENGGNTNKMSVWWNFWRGRSKAGHSSEGGMNGAFLSSSQSSIPVVEEDYGF